MNLSATIPPEFLQRSDESSSEFFSSSSMVQNHYSSEMIDRLLQNKALPEKGKLLQAVIEAGPLLETLLVAGYLPKWQNPPPLLSITPQNPDSAPSNKRMKF